MPARSRRSRLGGASQIEEADTPTEDAEVSQAQEVQEETSQAVEQSEAQPETAAESEVAVQEAKTDKAEAKVQTAENEIAVQDASEEEKAAAKEYLQQTYLAEGKSISSSLTRVNATTYKVGLKTPKGYSLNSIRLTYEGSSSSYMTGWYLEENSWLEQTNGPATAGKITITRPTTDNQNVKATLKLFAAGTSKDEIANGTAEALAEQEFTLIVVAEVPEVEYKLKVDVQDDNKNPITDATVTLEKDGWNKVTAETDGTYKVENDASYTLTVEKSGYETYTEKFSYTGNAEEPTLTKTVTLNPLVTKTFNFSVTDKATGATVSGATVKVKKGYYDTIQPESDGSYKLESGTSYNWTVTAANYKTASGTIKVELEKNITSYNVTFQPEDSETQEAISGAAITVEEETEDDWDDTTYWETVKTNSDGSYTLSKSGTYRYSVTAGGYKKVENVSYTPTGTEETITVPVAMEKDVQVDPVDQAAVDAVKAIYDKELGALRTSYKDYKNINAQVEAKLKAGEYASVDKADQVKVSVVSSDDTDWIGTDGVIHYSTADTLNGSGVYSKNVSVVLKFSLNGATATTGSRTVIVGWDQNHFASKMKAESDQLTWDKIKGSNETQTEVTSNLTLPQCMGTSLRQVWSTITWTSSNTDVVSIQKPSIDSPIYAATGVINQPVEDTEVTLTATFTANDTVMNEQVEKATDIATIRVPFTITVKGTGAVKPTEEELMALLDKYYTASDLKDFTSGAVLDPNACTGDIQLPRYTRIKDDNNDYVFANKEIEVTSDNKKIIEVNGYRAAVDVFAVENDTTVNLLVKFTRDGVSVTKKIPIIVKPNQDLAEEVKMMAYAKEHYFDGIKGNNVSEDKIIENLHPFQEMYFDADGKAVWVYDSSEIKGEGICADDHFEDTWEMEAAGYNKFKSSNPEVIKHENLVVIRPESPTEVTITSWLSSERYGQYAKNHPDNKTLQSLYKQEVSVTVTVQPEGLAKDQLQASIDKLQELLKDVTEGNGAGQYPAGTKDKLQTAIDEANALLKKEGVTDAELEAKAAELTRLLENVQDTQNETEVTVTVKMNQEAGKGSDVSKMTVKAHTAESYGYTKAVAYKNKVTVLDVIVAWHAAQYKDAFEKAPTDYLVVNGGFISRIYGVNTYDIGFCVNNKIPGSGTADAVVLENRDTISVFRYGDLKKYQDIYLYFEGAPETIKAGESVSLTLWGMHPMGYDANGNLKPATVQAGYTVAAVDEDGKNAVTAVTDKNGQATLQIKTAGTYQLTVTEAPKDSTESAYIMPKDTVLVTAMADSLTIPTIDENTDLSKLEIKDGDKVLKEGRDYTIDKTVDGNNVTVKITFTGAYTGEITRTYTVTPQEPPKHTHSFGPWYTVSGATTTSPEVQERVCACGEKETRTVGEPLKEHTHSYGAWYTVSAATVFAAEKQERVCACGAKETRTVGTALKKTIKCNMSYIPLKVKQTTTKFKVSGLAAGDSVASYSSSNKKIFTVDKNGKIKAGKKKGSAKLTITLKSGLKKTITVKVQRSTVKTQKIQNLKKTIVLKKGAKTTLKPVLYPLTSQQRVRYYSSRKRVATVSSKGVIRAKKAGKATITVKSGSKKFRITVKVK